mmetsp:Transcript_14958/g.26044  ORF Transcript_14958/g.26044 Transcript_14958/m.26044 type:complete len:276 (-) Transcript_14958:640-1467(-)
MEATPAVLFLICLPAIHIIEGIVAEDRIVVVITIVLGEGSLLTQKVEGCCHGSVLVLDSVLAFVGIGLDHCDDHFPALGRLGGVRGFDNLAADRVADSLCPHLHVHIPGGLVVLGVWHVRDDGQLLGARGEDHLAHVARAALAVLCLWVRVGVHRVHRREEQVCVALGSLDSGAEKVEATHVRRAFDLHPFLTALLDDRLEKLVLCLGSLLGGLGGLVFLRLLFLRLLLLRLGLLFLRFLLLRFGFLGRFLFLLLGRLLRLGGRGRGDGVAHQQR